MKIYLAAPFFNEKQVAKVERIERLFAGRGVDLYSPRSEGTLIRMTAEEKKASIPRIFKTNCEKLDWADLVFAIIDDRDQGVTWEIGYAYAAHKHIVTYSDENY